MKKMKRFVAAFAATTVLMSCVPSMTWAATVYGDGVDGNDVYFTKDLLMPQDVFVTNLSFKYETQYFKVSYLLSYSSSG